MSDFIEYKVSSLNSNHSYNQLEPLAFLGTTLQDFTLDSYLFLFFQYIPFLKISQFGKFKNKDIFNVISEFLGYMRITMTQQQVHDYYYRYFPKDMKQPFVDFLILKFGPILRNLKGLFSEYFDKNKHTSKLIQELEELKLQNKNLKEKNKVLKERIKELCNQNCDLYSQNLLLQEKIEFFSKESDLKQKTIDDPENFIFLYLHLKNVEHNEPGNRGNYYSDDYFEIKDSPNLPHLNLPFPYVHKYMYGILSFMPQFWYQIIQKLFNIPCYNTALKCRRDIQQKENCPLDNIKSTLLKINDHNMQLYIEGMWNIEILNLNDNRFVLAIDAASLKVNAGFRQNGQTFGLLKNFKLNNEQISKYSNNLQLFLKDFPNRAKYVFVLLLCPLDPTLKPIVISRKYASKGNASFEEIQLLNTAKIKLNSIGLNCVGFASDGDMTYQKYSIKFSKWIIGKDFIDILKTPLVNHISKSQMDPWFSDVLHLLKNHRYYLLQRKPIEKFYESVDTFKYSDLEENLSKIGDPIFNNSHSTKMDDRLAFRFFDLKNVRKAIDADPSFIPLLLPSALLLQVFFNKHLTRMERYHLLNFGAAVVYIQRILYLKDYKPNS